MDAPSVFSVPIGQQCPVNVSCVPFPVTPATQLLVSDVFFRVVLTQRWWAFPWHTRIHVQFTQTLRNVPPRNPKTPRPDAWPGRQRRAVRRPGAAGDAGVGPRLKRRLKIVAETLLKDNYPQLKKRHAPQTGQT